MRPQARRARGSSLPADWSDRGPTDRGDSGRARILPQSLHSRPGATRLRIGGSDLAPAPLVSRNLDGRVRGPDGTGPGGPSRSRCEIMIGSSPGSDRSVAKRARASETESESARSIGTD